MNNCKEALLENEDAVNNKDEYVKLFQKKFVEVEIYLQRITKEMEDLNDRQKRYYQNYKMDSFTNLNTTLNKKRETLYEEIKKYRKAKKNLKLENKKIRRGEKIMFAEENKKEKERKIEDKVIRKKNENIEKKYKKFIKNKVSKANAMKNFMNKFCNIDKVLNNNIINTNNINKITENDSVDKKEGKKEIVIFKKVAPKKNKNSERINSEVKEDEENEKSILPYEMTKRMNSFMDFSAILNDNSRIKEGVNKQKNVSRIVWEIFLLLKKTMIRKLLFCIIIIIF